MWGYRQVYTIAQIELFTCDVPLVVYGNKPKSESKNHTRREMEELTRRWNEKKEREKNNGEKFNLNDFLRTGKLNKE